MTRVTIPGTSLSVTPICLGGGEIGSSLDQEKSFALLDRLLELGGNFLDTARNYGDWVPGLEPGASERMIGAWMADRGCRDQIVLATKGGHPLMGPKPELPRLDRDTLVGELDASLAALRTDSIDLYWLHRDDPTRPVEDILETLNAQRNAGKIRYFGASNWKTPRLRAAYDHARAAGIAGFVADQSLWNAAPLARPPYGNAELGWMSAERFDFHEETGMAMIPYQSQAFGLFSRMAHGTLDAMNPGFRSFYKAEESAARYRRMTEIMAARGLTITQVTLGYLLSQPFVTLPIVGCRNVAYLEDSMSAADTRLAPQEVAALNAEGESIPE